MNIPRERQEAFDAWWERVLLFRRRAFPTDWAKVVNGVGLVSLVMTGERVFQDMAGHWNPAYLRRTGMAQATASDLCAMRASLDRALPALPPAPRTYFEELHTLVADGIGLVDRWWAVDASADQETAR